MDRRSSPAQLGPVRVDADFTTEYPDGDAKCTQVHASLCRTGQALLQELDRCVQAALGISQTASTALAVIDGAERPLSPSEIGERLLIASATMTSTLDQLERRGWIERIPNPDDRRSVLIQITPSGVETANVLLPGIRHVERNAIEVLSPTEQAQMLRFLTKILERVADLSTQSPQPLGGRRHRPERLTAP